MKIENEKKCFLQEMNWDNQYENKWREKSGIGAMGKERGDRLKAKYAKEKVSLRLLFMRLSDTKKERKESLNRIEILFDW